jgi:hypothetical protein
VVDHWKGLKTSWSCLQQCFTRFSASRTGFEC